MTDTGIREGTGVQGRSVTSDFERDVKTHYKKMSREQLICDTYGHTWPKIDPDPDVPLPAGFRASPSQIRGYLDLEEICDVCGEVRHSVLARGFLGERVQRGYKRPKSTVKRPEGYYGSRGDAQWELIRRAGVRNVLTS
jgi:hypothetical protein